MNSRCHRGRRGFSTVGVLAATAMVVAMAGTSAEAAGPGWRVVKTTDYSPYDAFNTVVAPGKYDAWAFGAQREAYSRGPAALHWTGTAWNTVELPAEVDGALTASGASSSSNVWAAGSRDGVEPYALRWDGRKWAVAKTWPDEGQITDVAAFSSTDVWVFGAPGANAGLGTWHFDGARWSQVELDFFPGTASAVSPGDIWAVGRGANGDARLVAHYDGASWEQVDVGDLLPPDIFDPDEEGLYQYVSLTDVEALSGDDVWVTGYVYRSKGGVSEESPVAIHWNGRTWQKVGVPGGWIPEDAAPDGAGGLWFDGHRGDRQVLAHRTAKGRWSTVGVKDGDRVSDVRELALIPGTRSLWGVGDLRPADGSSSDGAIFAYGTVPTSPATPTLTP